MERFKTFISSLIKMDHETKSHIFALIAPEEIQPLAHYTDEKTLIVHNKDFVFRITTILRLHTGEDFILFDHDHHLTCKITEITKKHIQCIVQNNNKNKRHLPEIRCIIPLLKREALATVVDSLTQLGATTIQLTTTQKTHHTHLTEKELDRLQRVIIAAAEQSKNYNFPLLQKPEPLTALPFDPSDPAIFCDPQGKNCAKILAELKSMQPKNITIIIGPEGDLTAHEKDFLNEKKVFSIRLTPTILRSEIAATLALGILRSIFNNTPD